MHNHTGSRFGLLAIALISAGTTSQVWADDSDSAVTLDTIDATPDSRMQNTRMQIKAISITTLSRSGNERAAGKQYHNRQA